MIDANTKVARYVVQGGVFAAAICTTVMNAKFGWSLGSDELEKALYAVFGIALDICKFFGLAYVAYAWTKNYKAKALAALVVWTVAVGYSLVAATGFAAMTRSHVTTERQFHADQAKVMITNHSRLAGELEVMKKNPRYESTSGCTAPQSKMKPESVIFCDNYFRHYNELETAAKNLPKGVQHDADPQMSFFAKHLGFEKEKMIAIWAFGLAIIAEIVASIGTYAFSSSRAKPDTSRKPVQSPVQVVNGQPVVRRRGRPPGSKNKPKLHVVNN